MVPSGTDYPDDNARRQPAERPEGDALPILAMASTPPLVTTLFADAYQAGVTVRAVLRSMS